MPTKAICSAIKKDPADKEFLGCSYNPTVKCSDLITLEVPRWLASIIDFNILARDRLAREINVSPPVDLGRAFGDFAAQVFSKVLSVHKQNSN